MMSKIRGGTFEQVESTISPSFIKSVIHTVKDFKGLKAFLFIVLFIGLGCYALFGVSLYMGNNIEEAVGGLDVNNEFIPFLSSIWYVHIQVIPISIGIIALFYFRDKDRMKGHFIYYVSILIFMMFFNLFLFKTTQLFVSIFLVRMLYIVLYIISFLYSLWHGYKNAMYMIYGPEKKRSVVVEWISKNQKQLLTVLGVIGASYFVIKAIFQPAADLETRIIGSLADFIPLFVIGINFVFIYFIGTVVRSYYTYKYAEQFRLKFHYEKNEWYGPKYKG